MIQAVQRRHPVRCQQHQYTTTTHQRSRFRVTNQGRPARHVPRSRLRREPLTEKTPIIMLTAKAAETDKIAGLELGADDYIVKPFSVKEVIARVRAVLRRVEKESAQNYEDERIAIDFADMRVSCEGDNVKLTRKEFALLAHLVKNTGRVATRQNLLDNVWSYNYFGDTRTLDVHIRRLRQKLGVCGSCIETVVGVGYRFIACK